MPAHSAVTKRLDLAASDRFHLEARRAALSARGGRIVEVDRPAIEVGSRVVAVSVLYRLLPE